MFFEWLGIALLLIVLVVLLYEDVRHLTTPRHRTSGRVVGHRSSLDDGSTHYISEVEYVDRRGTTHRIEDTIGTSTPKPTVGESVEVIYPTNTPQKGRVSHPVMRGFLYLMLLGMLAALIAKMLGWIEG